MAIIQPVQTFQIPHIILESTIKFFLKFCINIQCHQK